jgi:hypothetical protein
VTERENTCELNLYRSKKSIRSWDGSQEIRRPTTDCFSQFLRIVEGYIRTGAPTEHLGTQRSTQCPVQQSNLGKMSTPKFRQDKFRRCWMRNTLLLYS